MPAFLAKTGAGSAPPSGAARGDAGGGDDFASVMRKRASQADANKPAGHSESPSREAARQADKNQGSARARVRDESNARRPATAGDDKREADAAETQAAAQAQAGKRGSQASDGESAADAALPLDWPPAGLMLPSLLDAPMALATTAGGVAGDALLAGAANPFAAALPGPLRPLAVAMADAGIAGDPAAAAADGFPLAGATNADTAGGADGAAASARDGKLALPGFTTTAAAVALPAATLAPADAGALLPMGLAQFKDALEGAVAGKRDELPAAGAGFALAGAPAPSDNGLARTATVNPLTALTPDVNTDQFGETIGTQLTYMANEKISHAHIKVSPHDLGTIEVSLKLDGDRVHADFSSPQADVRQALEQSLPKLRELLGQQGFQLAQADVGHRQQQQAPSSGAQGLGDREGRGGGRGGFAGNGQPEATAPATAVRVTRGLVDAYA